MKTAEGKEQMSRYYLKNGLLVVLGDDELSPYDGMDKRENVYTVGAPDAACTVTRITYLHPEGAEAKPLIAGVEFHFEGFDHDEDADLRDLTEQALHHNKPAILSDYLRTLHDRKRGTDLHDRT